MAIRVDGRDIYLAVRDLAPAADDGPLLSSFPLPRRGALGQRAQKYFQRNKRQTGLFHSEYHISRSYEQDGFRFHLSGRIDGIYAMPGKLEVEEIKSVILNRAAFKSLQPQNMPHFTEQLLTYALMLAQEKPDETIRPYLVLINLTDLSEKKVELELDRKVREAVLRKKLADIARRTEEEITMREIRQDQAERMIPEPIEERPQQKEMMACVQRTVEQGGQLLVSAPTGTGKTAAALYPALSYAWANGKKVIFLTPKNSQHEVVIDALRPVRQANPDLRWAILKAARKLCANDIFFCHEAHCAYAEDFRKRLDSSNLTGRLIQRGIMRPEDIFDQARGEMLCPAEVNSDLAVRADVIVGDYNYVFDPAARFNRLFQKTAESDCILIIDEAHNLYDRGRHYLSPSLSRRKTALLLEHASSYHLAVYKKLARALAEIKSVFDTLQQEGETAHESQQYMPVQPDVARWRELQAAYEAAYVAYLIYRVKKNIVQADDPFEDYFYNLQRFARTLRLLDDSFRVYYDAADGGVLKLFCCDPALHLANIMQRFHAVIAMSATLDPMAYYREVLGFDGDAATLRLDSPFPSGNRKVVIVPDVSTLFKDRADSYPRIAEILMRSVALRQGNYLAFFPSYEYMQNVKLFMGRAPFEIYMQRPSMGQAEVENILAEIKNNGSGQLLMAVMGGIFAEGIDFKGDMAIGVFVISPALPRVDFERQLLHEYYENKNGNGTAYAYHYPGMNKVIQSVGRLIRGHSDKGVAVLIGKRFAQDHLNGLLPDYWFGATRSVVISADYESELKDFWSSIQK